MASDRAGKSSEKKAASKRKLWLGIGAGCGVLGLLLSCCCGVGVWMFYPWDGVSFSERGNITQLHNNNRQAGRENDFIYDLWDGADLTDQNGKKIRVVRVKYHARGTPDRPVDELFLFRDGTRENQMLNAFNETWKTGANGVDWQKVRKN